MAKIDVSKKMAFRWRTDDGPTLNAGLVACYFHGIQTSIAKKPYILLFFRGADGVQIACSPLDPRRFSSHCLWGFCVWSLFCYALIRALTIILTRK